MDEYTREIHHAGPKFTDIAAFCAYIEQKISQSITPQILTFTDISPAWVDDLLNSLQRKRIKLRFGYNEITRVFQLRTMPTPIHNCDQRWYQSAALKWVISGLITANEHNQITGEGNTLVRFTSGPDVGLHKMPNFMAAQLGTVMPTLAFESGWSESFADLQDDMNRWLVGGAGEVQAVIITKWTEIGNTKEVTGSIELYTLARDGTPRLSQREEVFPIPAGTGPGAQRIRLTRRMLFGKGLSPGRNPRDVFGLDVDNLRVHARESLARSNKWWTIAKRCNAWRAQGDSGGQRDAEHDGNGPEPLEVKGDSVALYG
ncbi:hypothetical protein AWENTII_001635 [Aspergillus wentii]